MGRLNNLRIPLMKSNKTINLVTVNFNSTKETIDMLSSITNKYVDKIVVVDNFSSDQQYKLLNDYCMDIPIVTIIRLDENIGYFPALNQGLKAISDSNKKTGYTIICNNDLLFNDSFFKRLSKRNFKGNIMALSPSVKTINGVYQNPSLLKKPSKFRFLGYRIYYSNYFLGKIILNIWRLFGLGIDSNYTKDKVEKEIFIGIGAIFILLPNFFHKNECLDYPLFLYGEEAFFSAQLAKSGGSLFYVPDIEVIHLESVTTKKIPSKKNYLLNKKAFIMSKDFYR